MYLKHTGVSVTEIWPLKGVRLFVFYISFLTNSSIYMSDFKVLEELTTMDSKTAMALGTRVKGTQRRFPPKYIENTF